MDTEKDKQKDGGAAYEKGHNIRGRQQDTSVVASSSNIEGEWGDGGTKKDTQKGSDGSAVFDDREIVKDVTDTGLLSYVYKKTEKITAVVYLITEQFAAEEPLRWRLRKAVTALLEEVAEVRYAVTAGTGVSLYRVEGRIAELLSLVRIAMTSELVSRMNGEILGSELEGLEATIAERHHAGEPMRSLVFSDRFFEEHADKKDVGKHREGPASDDPARFQFYAPRFPDSAHARGEAHGQSVSRAAPRHSRAHASASHGASGTEEYAGSGKPASAPQVQASVRRSGAKKRGVKESRRGTIKDILREKDNATIKEIARAVNGCSEKTVQRELNALISEGEVKREGERRWSRYSLAR